MKNCEHLFDSKDKKLWCRCELCKKMVSAKNLWDYREGKATDLIMLDDDEVIAENERTIQDRLKKLIDKYYGKEGKNK